MKASAPDIQSYIDTRQAQFEARSAALSEAAANGLGELPGMMAEAGQLPDITELPDPAGDMIPFHHSPLDDVDVSPDGLPGGGRFGSDTSPPGRGGVHIPKVLWEATPGTTEWQSWDGPSQSNPRTTIDLNAGEIGMVLEARGGAASGSLQLYTGAEAAREPTSTIWCEAELERTSGYVLLQGAGRKFVSVTVSGSMSVGPRGPFFDPFEMDMREVYFASATDTSSEGPMTLPTIIKLRTPPLTRPPLQPGTDEFVYCDFGFTIDGYAPLGRAAARFGLRLKSLRILGL